MKGGRTAAVDMHGQGIVGHKPCCQSHRPSNDVCGSFWAVGCVLRLRRTGTQMAVGADKQRQGHMEVSAPTGWKQACEGQGVLWGVGQTRGRVATNSIYKTVRGFDQERCTACFAEALGCSYLGVLPQGEVTREGARIAAPSPGYAIPHKCQQVAKVTAGWSWFATTTDGAGQY